MDILHLLAEDHDRIRRSLALLQTLAIGSEESRALKSFSLTLEAHARAEGEVVVARLLELESARLGAIEALEGHDLVEALVKRLERSAHEEQLRARFNVLHRAVEQHLTREEAALFPEIRRLIGSEEREELGMRYRETKERNELAPIFRTPTLAREEAGRVGYVIAWLLGVPAWILLLVFLLRGH